MLQPSSAPRAEDERRSLSHLLSLAFFTALLVSLSCYVINQRGMLSDFQQGLHGLASTLTLVPQLNLSQEFPSPSLGLLTFLISGGALFVFTLREVFHAPVSVRLTAATIVSTSYVIITHEVLDCLPAFLSPTRISDSSLGVVGLLTITALVCTVIFRFTGSNRMRRHLPQRRPHRLPLSRPGTTESPVWLHNGMSRQQMVVFGFCLLAVALAYWFALRAAAGSPPTGWDGLWYHLPVATAIIQFGSLREFWLGGISNTPITLHASNPAYAYPTAGSILHSLNLRAGADRWSFLWQMLGVCLLCAATYVLARALGTGKGHGLVVSAACVLVPIVVFQSTTVLVDNLAAGFASSSWALLIFLLRTPFRSQGRKLLFFVSGLASGLAIATKSASLPFALASVLVASVVSYATATEPGRLRGSARDLSLFCAGLLAVGGYWYIRNWILLGNPIYPFRLGAGNITVFPGLDPKTFWAQKEFQFVQSRADWLSILWNDPPWSDEAGTGPVGALALPALIFAALTSISVQHAREKMGAYLVLSLVVLCVGAWWVFSQHEPRYLIAIFPLCLSLLGMVWSTCTAGSQWTIGILLCVVLIGTASLLGQALVPSIAPAYDRTAQYSWATGSGVQDPSWVDRLPEGTTILNDQQGEGGWVTLASNHALTGLRHTNVVLTDPHLVTCESETRSLERLQSAGVSLIYRRVSSDLPPPCYQSWAPIHKLLESTSGGYTVRVFQVATEQAPDLRKIACPHAPGAATPPKSW